MGGDKREFQEITVRHASYLEEYHKWFINRVGDHVLRAVSGNPYLWYEPIDFDVAFFGAGFALGSFPSLYDMYGKFMAGLDLEVLFGEIHEDTINGRVVNETISQEAARLDDDLIENAYPRFETGMRDVNSVMSSTFIVGRAMLEANRQRALERFAAEARYRLLPVVTERWRGHLSWNQTVIEMYAQILKLYISAKVDSDNQNYEMASRRVLWPFNAFQYETAAIGAISGATNTSSELSGGSRAGRVIGSAMTGAAGGAMVGAQIGATAGPWGAAIGGLVGLVAGLF